MAHGRNDDQHVGLDRTSERAEVITLSHPDGEECPGDSRPADAGLLQVVCDSMASLLAKTPNPPRRVFVRAGAIAVELEWPDASGRVIEQTVPVAPAAAPGATSGTALNNGTAPPSGTAALGAPASAAAAESAGREEDDGLFFVRACTVGTFYRAPESGAKPFVTVGDEVHPGQQLGILEAMKMMLPVECDRSGRVAEFFVADATAVEFDARLIALATTEPGP